MKIYNSIDTSTTAGAKYSSLLQSAVSQWNGLSCGSVSVSTSITTYSGNANVFISNSSYIWNNLGVSPSTLARTRLYDTQGNLINTASAAQSSLGFIKEADIYLNPSLNAISSNGSGGSVSGTTLDDRIKKVIAHEMGHAMLLGHSDRSGYAPIGSTVPSLMRQGYYNGSTIPLAPAAHEISDVQTKYQYHTGM